MKPENQNHKYHIKFEPSGLQMEVEDRAEFGKKTEGLLSTESETESKAKSELKSKKSELKSKPKSKRNLLSVIQKAGLSITAPCAGGHSCGKCRVRILQKDIPFSPVEKTLLSSQDMENGIHLACEVSVTEDLTVELFQPEEAVIVTEMLPLEEKKAPEEAVLKLSEACQSQKQEQQQGQKREWLLEHPGNVELGAAIDMGTTTLAAYLYDLRGKKKLSTASMLNPQIPYGDDVISRIAFCTQGSEAQQKEKLQKLQKLMQEAVNSLLRSLTEQARRKPEEIRKLVLVGNTVMEHIFLGISPACLGHAPFQPEVRELQRRTPEELGVIMNPEGMITFLPAAAGFVGADHLAALLAVKPRQYQENVLLIDIGTNSEICLTNGKELYATSCATGPALEGAQISCGMRAARGAIDKVQIDLDTLEPQIHILGEEAAEEKNAMEEAFVGADAERNAFPTGICGSGILDAVAQMVKTGILQRDGAFSPRARSPRIRTNEKGEKEYILWKHIRYENSSVSVTQRDVRAIQLAKAALYAGIQILQKKSGIQRIERIILAGGFGCYIEIPNALILGMFPDMDSSRIQAAGNAAGEGASLALLDDALLKKTSNLSEEIIFVESASDPQFSRCYADAMAFPHQRAAFPISTAVIWSCPGTDTHFLPKEVYEKDMEILCEETEIRKILPLIAKYNHEETGILPIIQNQEACVYGAPMSKKAGFWASGAYPFASLAEAEEHFRKLGKGYLSNDSRTKALYETIRYLKNEENRSVILEVQAPFSILMALVEPAKVFSALRKKNTSQIEELISWITEDISLYLEKAIKSGCTLISLADPLGSISLNGPRLYEQWIASWEIKLLKRCRRILKPAVMHLCGRMSADLISTGFLTAHPIRMNKEKTYIENLLELAEDPKIRYMGLGCIRCNRPENSVAYGLELTDYVTKKADSAGNL